MRRKLAKPGRNWSSIIRNFRVRPKLRASEICSTDLLTKYLIGGNIGAVYLHAPPYDENVQALVRRSVSEQDTVFLPWSTGEAVLPLVGVDNVAHVAAAILISSGRPHQNAYDLMALCSFLLKDPRRVL